MTNTASQPMDISAPSPHGSLPLDENGDQVLPDSPLLPLTTLIPSHPYDSAYQPFFFTTLLSTPSLRYTLQDHFRHLNCSFLSHPTSPPPSLLHLKQHAQALTLLISLLQSQDLELPPNPHDHLDDLQTPYTNPSPTHNLSLTTLANPLAPRTSVAQPSRSAPHCPYLSAKTTTSASQIQHANALLETIDHTFAPSGGLFAILPPPSTHPTAHHQSQETLLGQLLRYTQSLVDRVAELELEVASSREVIAGPIMVPRERGRGRQGRGSVFEQDRYVLSGLSEGLWSRLGEELRIAEGVVLERGRRAGEKLRKRGRGEDFGDKDGEVDAEDDVVAWIEVTSRIFRVKGQKTMFVIPGWDVHPGAEAVRRLERQPLVQTVARRGGETGKTALERREEREFEGMRERVRKADGEEERLRHSLHTERLMRKRGEEALEREKSSGAGAQMGYYRDMARREREECEVLREEKEGGEEEAEKYRNGWENLVMTISGLQAKLTDCENNLSYAKRQGGRTYEAGQEGELGDLERELAEQEAEVQRLKGAFEKEKSVALRLSQKLSRQGTEEEGRTKYELGEKRWEVRQLTAQTERLMMELQECRDELNDTNEGGTGGEVVKLTQELVTERAEVQRLRGRLAMRIQDVADMEEMLREAKHEGPMTEDESSSLWSDEGHRSGDGGEGAGEGEEAMERGKRGRGEEEEDSEGGSGRERGRGERTGMREDGDRAKESRGRKRGRR